MRLTAGKSCSRSGCPVYADIMDLQDLPGWELVGPGLEDLRRGRVTVEALLVSIGEVRLREAGLEVPTTIPDSELRLYELLARDDQDSAHGRYNALVRRLVSFEQVSSRLTSPHRQTAER
jgi:hypothetical protein